MELILAAQAVWLAGGLLSLLAGRNGRLACVLGPASVVAGGVIALVPSLRVLLDGPPLAARFAWEVPLGSCALGLDALSALFAVAILAVSILAAIYGGQYLQAYRDKRALGPSWFFFNLLVASMLLVVLARNGVLFLVSWEIMSLASFFLVMFESEKEHVRRAGWTYLVATHLGTAFLLAMFALLGSGCATACPGAALDQTLLADHGTSSARVSGPRRVPDRRSPAPAGDLRSQEVARSGDRPQHGVDLDFAAFHPAPEVAGAIFVLALIGFGTKAGFLSLHVWLPEAHPAAPSHVSAVMSGVMIKTGIYGLLRVLTFLGPPPAWWGWTLIAIGILSAILGVLFALAQHDLKRLLAYCSMENIGIISLGLGIGFLGMSLGNPAMAALGLTGGLLHVINHAIFKSLLFFGAGSVIHATGTAEIDQLGGLLKRMPMTGLTFLVGAVAIAGLPPLNGFVSELLIYLGAFHGLVAPLGSANVSPTASILGIGTLALVGGLAAACFAKAFGMAFLGEPRSPRAEHGHEAGAMMLGPMLTLAAACVVIGVSGPWLPGLLAPAVTTLMPEESHAATDVGLEQAALVLRPLSVATGLLLGLTVTLALVRKRLLRGRSVDRAGTWDCGYVLPTAKMQYTGSSFVRPITQLFRILLRTRTRIRRPEGLFPKRAELHTETPDVFCERFYQPLFDRIRLLTGAFHWLQHGRLQLYVLYIALTILVLLVWKLG